MTEISVTKKIYTPTTVSNYQSRNSDIDFSDVFGGPPRRSSTQEFCYNERTSIDSHGIDDTMDETEASRSSPWFTLREKPVFGDEVVERRRYPSEDFFDDVFRGDQPGSSCSQSPRVMPRRNPFASAPHSRAMSPSRSLPPTGALASPEIFRLKRSIKIQNEGLQSTSKSIDLSHDMFASRKEAPCYSQLNRMEGRPQDQAYPKSSLGGADIHFSFYKWVSNDVPLVVSLRKIRPKLKEEITPEDSKNVDKATTTKKGRKEGMVQDEGQEHFSIRDANNVTNVASPTYINELKDDLVINSSSNINIASTIMSNVEVLETESEDAIQVYQTKVSQWAKRKEGNIRSLLSTLQLVLWENSGWTPIPLVEIIEANAVKRAYQKALLCLHPDKLQQTGATAHHKFVAEKVFDILQEAWDHFSSLSHL